MAAIDADRLLELDQLLGSAFGPHGRAVLSRNPTGQMTITRSGISILKTVYSDDDSPFMKIIMNCAGKVHDALGDGVKSFVFVTAAVLLRCRGLEGKSRIVRQLGVLQSELSQLSIKCERSYESTDDCPFFNIVISFFNTRFPVSVSNFLARFLHEWMSTSLACTCTASSTKMSSLFRDFPNLCSYESGAARSVTDSYVKSGLSINGRVLNVIKSGPKKLIIAAFGDTDSDDGRFNSLDVKCEIDRLLMDLKRQKAKAKVSPSPELLLLSSHVLSDLTLFNLTRENIGVIHGVPSEEITFLESKVLVERQDDCAMPHDLIVNVDVDEGLVLLGLPAVHQMFICGPTKELRLEYALTCRSALKLLAETSESMQSNLYTKGGGHFESTLHKVLAAKYDKFNNRVPRFSSRAELLNWHRLKVAHQMSESAELDGALTKIADAFSVLDGDVFDAILEGILAVPCKLPKDCFTSEKPVETVSLRLGILIHALSAVTALLRCDNVIFIKKPFKNS